MQEYLDRLQHRFGRASLQGLTPVNRQEGQSDVLMAKVFVAQRVRHSPPPPELPRELWRRLTQAGDLGPRDVPEGLDREMLKRLQKAYQDRPAVSVLDVLGNPEERKVVVLGDPGQARLRWRGISCLPWPGWQTVAGASHHWPAAAAGGVAHLR